MKDINALRNIKDNRDVHVQLHSKKYDCSFTLHDKFTRIVGDSGKGKTEFLRQLQNPVANITISNGYNIEQLTYAIFKRMVRVALNHKTPELNYARYLKQYWSDQGNNPYEHSIIVIDDEDLAKSEEFAVFYNCDKSNYFICIDRSNLPQISYSPNSIYEFVSDGRLHSLKPVYSVSILPKNVDYILVEGIGSDFIYFSKLFNNKVVFNPTDFEGILSGGRTNIENIFAKYFQQFANKHIFLIIDYCAFGSNVDFIFDICKKHNITLSINPVYLSFEYMLLKSNMLNDEIDNALLENRAAIPNVEAFITDRLIKLTKGTYFSYAKSKDKFSICYYCNCCQNQQNKGDCKYRIIANAEHLTKFEWMLLGTKFQYLLEV